MITIAGADKDLAEMSDFELSAIIADHSHIISRRRYVNAAHRNYLEARLQECQLERAARH